MENTSQFIPTLTEGGFSRTALKYIRAIVTAGLFRFRFEKLPERKWKLFPFFILGFCLAVSPLPAKDSPKSKPTPDPALELSPAQELQIHALNDYYEQMEKPLRAAIQKARAEYKIALKVKPVDQAALTEKAAAGQKLIATLEAQEALHRSNILVLLTPAQRDMITKLQLTGKAPGDKEDDKSKNQGQ